MASLEEGAACFATVDLAPCFLVPLRALHKAVDVLCTIHTGIFNLRSGEFVITYRGISKVWECHTGWIIISLR